MNNNTQLFVLVSLLSLTVFCTSPPKTKRTAEKPEKFNVLFIAVDDLRPELGSYGVKTMRSPNIDRLASMATQFDRAYCNIPVCGASRASLLSGLRPTRNRFLNYTSMKDKEAPGVVSLPGLFKENGYTTHSYGKVYHDAKDDRESWDLVWRQYEPGNHQDYFLPENKEIASANKGRAAHYEMPEAPDSVYRDGVLAQKAIGALKSLKQDGEPFFLALGFWKPHLPFNAPKKYWDMYDPAQFQMAPGGFSPASAPAQAFHNSGELRNYTDIPRGKEPLDDSLARRLIHGYYASVSYMDAQLGKVLDALEELGLAGNTIVVLWGDHGWNLREHGLWCKHASFETSLHAPLIIKVPGAIAQQSDAIVEFVDIYPTLADLAGLQKPGHLQGASMAGMVMGEGAPEDGMAISKWQEGTTLITRNYFYTQWTDENDSIYATMLYDHSSDPKELQNLSVNPSNAGLVDSLSAVLRKNLNTDYWQ